MTRVFTVRLVGNPPIQMVYIPTKMFASNIIAQFMVPRVWDKPHQLG